jgi:ABC-type taurine transport system ATPase subunit
MVNCQVEGTPISHRFGDFVAVRDINLDIAGGELVALLGPHNGRRKRRLRPRGAQMAAPAHWTARRRVFDPA